MKSDELDDVLLHFDALESIYAVDENYMQLSPIFNKNEENSDFKANHVKKSLKIMCI